MERQNCLPARNAAQLKKRLENGVERSIPRSTDWDVLKDNYSRKKKTHTNKNTLFSGSAAQIHYLSDTYEGRENVEIIMPVKKPKGKTLNQQQKAQNTLIAKIRVKVEHLMSGIKRLRVVKDKVRAWADDFRDQVKEIACALHNFRLKYRPWKYPNPEKICKTKSFILSNL
ncbi:MAG: transposase family protein [Flammeovirgaceae bacterium]|nr:transposase family protein [Flammeovirgaceae bacterium]